MDMDMDMPFFLLLPEHLYLWRFSHRQDVDGDGFLYSEELKTFATEMGFEGSDSEWSQEGVPKWTRPWWPPVAGEIFGFPWI